MDSFEIEVVHSKSGKTITTLKDLDSSCTILDVKEAYRYAYPKYYLDRQSFRLEAKGKGLKDTDVLKALGIKKGSKLYFKDLGPQIGWGTVFIAEYAGPLLIYLMFFPRPPWVYGFDAVREPRAEVVSYACICWSVHYAKRLLETMFVHRFSNGTMPIMNLFKNCSYYWGFTAFVAYFVNHPQYTPPLFGDLQMYIGLGLFTLCELGNLSVHVALRNLRPAGSKERKIPRSTINPLTWLFSCVSCPNYTYEVGAWFAFSLMTQSLPALLFCGAGFYQMAIWAQGKHKNYKKEFKDYPRGRKAILPFLI